VTVPTSDPPTPGSWQPLRSPATAPRPRFCRRRAKCRLSAVRRRLCRCTPGDTGLPQESIGDSGAWFRKMPADVTNRAEMAPSPAARSHRTRPVPETTMTAQPVQPTRHDPTPELLTITEAAELLRAPVATLRYWRHLGTG